MFNQNIKRLFFLSLVCLVSRRRLVIENQLVGMLSERVLFVIPQNISGALSVSVHQPH